MENKSGIVPTLAISCEDFEKIKNNIEEKDKEIERLNNIIKKQDTRNSRQRIANRKLLERNQDLVIENLKLNNTINKFENSLIESNKYISNPAFRELFREQLEYLQELKGSDK